LTFLYYPKVPSVINACERAIRTAKVKMKISNLFKTMAGAHRFAVLRFTIDPNSKYLVALCLLPNWATE
jgi:hypothetical protein